MLRDLLRIVPLGGPDVGSAGILPALGAVAALSERRKDSGHRPPLQWLLGRDAPATAAGTAALRHTLFCSLSKAIIVSGGMI